MADWSNTVTASTNRETLVCSVEVGYTSTGRPSFTVKTYHAPGQEAEAVQTALKALQSIAAVVAPEISGDIATRRHLAADVSSVPF